MTETGAEINAENKDNLIKQRLQGRQKSDDKNQEELTQEQIDRYVDDIVNPQEVGIPRRESEYERRVRLGTRGNIGVGASTDTVRKSDSSETNK